MESSTTYSSPFAVVTGASTGIGYHLARIFAEEDFDVLITADELRIQEAAREIELAGGRVYAVQADLTRPEEVERLWQEVEKTGRDVDAIAINAGIGTSGDFSSETDLRQEKRNDRAPAESDRDRCGCDRTRPRCWRSAPASELPFADWRPTTYLPIRHQTWPAR